MKSIADFQQQLAQHSSEQALASARATLQRALAELDSYIERYQAAGNPQAKADVLNWTLNHLATYIPSNVRLDLIASAQAQWQACQATE